MAGTLILMRHGKSDYPDGVADAERPLAERGIREAELAGEWLSRDGFEVDAVICSTATRTRETLQRTGIDADSVTFVDALYGGTPDDVFEAIREHVPEDAETVLVIGHEPGMPATVLTLDPDADIDRFPTSAYAVVRVDAAWDQIGISADDINTFEGLHIPR